MSKQLPKTKNMVIPIMMNNKHEYESNSKTNVSLDNKQPGISSNNAYGSTNMSFNNQLGMTFNDSYDSSNIGNYLMGYNNQCKVNLGNPCGSNKMKILGINNQSSMNFNEMRNFNTSNHSRGSLTNEFGLNINMIKDGLNNQFGLKTWPTQAYLMIINQSTKFLI